MVVYCHATMYPLILNGGSAWESNPPETLLTPPTGFEVQEGHQTLTTSLSSYDTLYHLIGTRSRIFNYSQAAKRQGIWY